MHDWMGAAVSLWKWIFGAGLSLIAAALSWAAYFASRGATREHVALETARRAVAEEKLAQAEKEVDQLRETVRQLMEEVSKSRTVEQFDEEKGILFKRRAGGGYHDAVYCPICKAPLRVISRDGLYCDGCARTFTARASEIPNLRHLLLGRQSPPE